MPKVVPCPGSKTIQEAYPSQKTTESNEGSVAHAIAAEVLSEEKSLASYIGTIWDEVYINQEMAHHIAVYVEECRSHRINGVTEGALGSDYEGHTLTGTPDHWHFGTSNGILRIIDLKFGYRWVEVYMNWQLLTYAMLVWEHILNRQPGAHNLFKTIELVIVQPRASHPAGKVRRWSFDADMIRNYRNVIIGAMREAALDNPPVKTGDHCRDCRGLIRCYAAGAAAAAAIEYAGTVVHGEMSPDVLALEMDLVDRAGALLKQRRTALEEVGLMLCRKGTRLQGWEARSVMGALSWDVEDAVSIGQAMKKDLSQPIKPITPTQAMERGVLTEKQVKALASRKLGAPKLKRIDNAVAERILSQ